MLTHSLSCDLGPEVVRLCLEQGIAENLQGSLNMGFQGLMRVRGEKFEVSKP